MLDFTSALACLLRDGRLRERFAEDPAGALADLPMEEGDRLALVGLDSRDLEIQASVLLHKRFEEVRRVLPQTCLDLGDSAWPIFQKYARYYWPNGDADIWADACAFGGHLARERRDAVAPVEKNRLIFAVGVRRLAICFLRHLPIGGRCRPAMQIFWRPRLRTWREFIFFPGL